MECSAIILAGGKSSRMGIDKALIPFKDRTLIESIADLLTPIFDEVLVVTNDPLRYQFLKFDKLSLVKDIFPRKGPLGGIHAGLTYMNNEYGFVTACDMPFIEGEVIIKMLKLVIGYDGLVPKKGEYFQPLFAVYSKRCIEAIEKSLNNNNNRITAFYQDVDLRYLNWDELLKGCGSGSLFFNLNTPEDLEILKEMQKD